MNRQDRSDEVTATYQIIAKQQDLVLPAETLAKFKRWEFETAKKIIMPLPKSNGLGKVLVRLRPSFSTLTKEQFVADEQQLQNVAVELKKVGIITTQNISNNFDHEPLWVTREFIDGKITGTFAYDQEVGERPISELATTLHHKLNQVYALNPPLQLESPDWFAAWRQEFADRRGFVVTHFGENVAATIEQLLERPGRDQLTRSVIHSDMAPANLILHGPNVVVIDWGGTRFGSRIIDLATIWWFSFYLPQARQVIAQEIIQAGSPEAVAEAKDIALRVIGRLFTTFAEWLEFYSTHPTEDPGYIAELERLLPLARESFTTATTLFHE